YSHLHVDHPDLHSLPTRRSSDLTPTNRNARTSGKTSLSRSPSCGTTKRGWANPSTTTPTCPSWLQPETNSKQSYPGLFPSPAHRDRKSTRLNSSHQIISYAVFCL